jgi:hypothetical protein
LWQLIILAATALLVVACSVASQQSRSAIASVSNTSTVWPMSWATRTTLVSPSCLAMDSYRLGVEVIYDPIVYWGFQDPVALEPMVNRIKAWRLRL